MHIPGRRRILSPRDEGGLLEAFFPGEGKLRNDGDRPVHDPISLFRDKGPKPWKNEVPDNHDGIDPQIQT